MRRRVAAIEAHRNRLRRRNESLRSKTVAKRNDLRNSARPLSYERASRLIGDHWTLLIVRELMLSSSLTFTELLVVVRGISTNILSRRLHRLVSQRVLTVDQSREDGRKQFYSLTPIGADLQPVIRSIDLWGREFTCCISTHTKGFL